MALENLTAKGNLDVIVEDDGEMRPAETQSTVASTWAKANFLNFILATPWSLKESEREKRAKNE